MKALAWGYVLLFSLPLWAGGGGLQQAQKLFYQTEYRQALRILDGVLRSPGANPKQFREALRLSGLCYSAMGKSARAEASFLRLLALDPSYRLPASVSPKLRPPFERALRKAAARGSLQVGKPRSRQVAPGRWHVQIKLQADPYRMVSAVRLRYRSGRGKKKSLVAPLSVGETSSFSLEATSPKQVIRYRLELLNRHGGVLRRIDSRGRPFELRTVVSTPEPVAAATTTTSLVKKDRPPVTSTTTAVTGSTAVDTRKTKPVVREKSWWQSWWFWTIVGVAVAGAATGTVVCLTTSSAESWPVRFQVKVQ